MSDVVVRYRPSEAREWVVAVADGRLLAVRNAVDADRLDEMWKAVEAGKPMAEIVDRVIGGSVANAPDFTLVGWDGDDDDLAVHVFARGTFGATVTTAEGSERIDSAGTTTWEERRIVGVHSVAIGDLEADGGLPMANGVAYADACRATVGARGGSSSVREIATPRRASEDTIVAPVDETVSASEATPEPTDVSMEDSAVGAYDHLFGATVVRPIEDAAVRPAADEEPESAGDEAEAPSDHTVVTKDLEALRARRRKDRGTRAPAPADPVPAPAAPTYFLEASNGRREVIDGTLLLGRAPVVSRVSGGVVPRLVKVTTPNQELSRTHLEVKVEGDAVVATDLHSKNGTMVTAPGKPPQQLRAGEPTTIINGSLIDLGDTAVFTVGEE